MRISIADKAYKEKDYKKALEYYQKAADMGSASAYDDLRDMYQKGLGVPKDAKKASQYYKKVCDIGYKDSCKALAKLHP
ncbi:tetratricopeptide repeat protein [Helicobacter bizzozeronii]|uniref:tetratricopeptide repeat protein n=1 Tax=Helicobacter bizzozeronii TaxID=56877 RepID=UPI000CF1950A|nr:SEL1-like repeat protein [Helicobacter bizzozeronii]